MSTIELDIADTQPPTDKGERIVAIINTQSGTVPDTAADDLTAAITALGRTVEIHEFDPDKLASQMSPENLPDGSMVIAWGGDGTFAALMQHVRDRDVTLLPLPGGTMNMLHKAVHCGASDWDDCLSLALTDGTTTSISAGEVAGHRFYVGAFVGNLAALAEPREALRDGELLTAMRQLTDPQLTNFDTRLDVELIDDGKVTESFEAVALALFMPKPNERQVFDFGAINPHTTLELAAISAEALAVGWRDASQVHFKRPSAVRIRRQDGAPIVSTLDGETVELPAEVTFKIIEGAARVRAAV